MRKQWTAGPNSVIDIYMAHEKPFDEIEGNRLFYAGIYYTVKSLGRLLLGLRITGQENIPSSGPAIVAADHHDMLDIFMLPVAIPHRHISMVARKEIYDYPVIGPMFRRWDTISFDRDKMERESYREIKERLAANRLVGIFPGKTRTAGPGIGEFDPAVAGYAMYSNVVTIPTAISGLDEAFTRRHRWNARVDFGEAIGPPCNKQDQGRYMFELTTSVRALSKRKT